MPFQTQTTTESYDERLQIEIERVLRASGHVGLWNVTVNLSDGHATLCGKVPTYFLKQIAFATVRATKGIQSVSDDLVVC